MDTMKGMITLLGMVVLLNFGGVFASSTPDTTVAETTMAPRYQCYNFSCVSPSMDCLTKSIMSNLVNVPSCCGGGQYCKVTRATKDGLHTIVAECVKEDCEYTETVCPVNGDVVFNCCNSQHCNTELLLGPLPPSSSSSFSPRPLAAASVFMLLTAFFGISMP
ncbi:uncharacterized protein LOC143291913 [Babylonia areolata]|uniref:uncharacterized protein LOC143291913 n=1 Tax=Babylonia areolata TaxID=304850 RepID=UPI003FD03B56